MLNEDIKKELDKYNQDKKAQYKPTCPRMAKVHEQDHEEFDDSPDHPEPDLENHSIKNPVLCMILTLRIFWKHIPHTLQIWHQHAISLNMLPHLMGLK